MKVLVLGGTGAMGISLVQILSENPENEVYVTSRSARVSLGNVHYIQGNAHDISFIKEILKNGYDAIVDFMVYTPDEFLERVELLLAATKQYIFLSSSRVYADAGDTRITEQSPRLLDVCTDTEYLATNEYALAKAREENILFDSCHRNWTIIRPYITYNDNRLQLGVDELQTWLYRALNRKAIVFPKDITEKSTTLTYGYDVAKVMGELIGNEKAFGQVFHIATEQSVQWSEVLKLYLDVIEREMGYRPKIFIPDDSKEIGETCGNKYQISCDRLYNRCFSSEKVNKAVGYEVVYTDVREGLEKCLTNYLRSGKGTQCTVANVRKEAYYDKLTKEKTSLGEFKTLKAKIAYMILRYTSFKI